MKLPESVISFFWDTKIESLDINTHKKHIIERILEYGQKKDIDWLESQYGIKTISQIIKDSKKISNKTANAMAIKYNINRKEIQCLSKRYMTKQHRF